MGARTSTFLILARAKRCHQDRRASASAGPATRSRSSAVTHPAAAQCHRQQAVALYGRCRGFRSSRSGGCRHAAGPGGGRSPAARVPGAVARLTRKVTPAASHPASNPPAIPASTPDEQQDGCHGPIVEEGGDNKEVRRPAPRIQDSFSAMKSPGKPARKLAAASSRRAYRAHRRGRRSFVAHQRPDPPRDRRELAERATAASGRRGPPRWPRRDSRRERAHLAR
jgi:hypothetical protein